MATMLISPLQARVTGQAGRRGLIPRVPGADSLLTDIETWLRATFPEMVRSTERPVRDQGEAELAVELHPAAPPLVITASDTGRVALTAETVGVGPGYHRFVGRLVERLGEDLSLNWDRGAADPDAASDGRETTFAERSATEAAYLAWFGRSLVSARATRAVGGGQVQIGIPGTTRYTFDGAIATALGPRDEA